VRNAYNIILTHIIIIIIIIVVSRWRQRAASPPAHSWHFVVYNFICLRRRTCTGVSIVFYSIYLRARVIFFSFPIYTRCSLYYSARAGQRTSKSRIPDRAPVRDCHYDDRRLFAVYYVFLSPSRAAANDIIITFLLLIIFVVVVVNSRWHNVINRTNQTCDNTSLSLLFVISAPYRWALYRRSAQNNSSCNCPVVCVSWFYDNLRMPPPFGIRQYCYTRCD